MNALSALGVVFLVVLYMLCYGLWMQWSLDDFNKRNRHTKDVPVNKYTELAVEFGIGVIAAPIAVPMYYICTAAGYILKLLMEN